MVSAKTALLGVAGAVVAAATLRTYRQRQADPREEAQDAASEAVEEAAQALEHSAASIDHARTAGEKAIETASEELEGVRGTVATEEDSERQGRLRTVVGRQR